MDVLRGHQDPGEFVGIIQSRKALRGHSVTVPVTAAAGDTPDEGSYVVYLPGDTIPPEHRDLPTVAAVHRRGLWEPAGS